MTHEDIQILISAYLDGEVTPSEKNMVEEHLSTCQICQKDFKSYKALSSSLSKWSNESLSPDEVIKVQKHFEPRRESMFTKRTMMVFTTTLALTVIVGSVVQTYIKKGFQGGFKMASDDIADQYTTNSIAQLKPSGLLRNNFYPMGMSESTQMALPIRNNFRLAGNFFNADSSSIRQRIGFQNTAYHPYSLESSYLGAGMMAAKGLNASPLVAEGASSYYQNSDVSYYNNDEERKKIQRAEISLLVENAFRTKSQLTDLIMQFNGIIESSEFNRTADGAGQGAMVCKVYPKDLEHALQQIRKLGEVENENESSSDVTDQYNDARKNIIQYTSDKDHLEKMVHNFRLFNPTTDDEKENIQREITQAEDEIKMLDRQIKFYQDQTSMSVIVVNFYDKYKNSMKENDSSNKWKVMFENKWEATRDASVEVFSNILFGVIFLLSFVVPVLIWCVIFGIIYLIVRMFFKK